MVIWKIKTNRAFFLGSHFKYVPNDHSLSEKKQTVQYHRANKKAALNPQQESPQSRYVCTDMYESKAYLYVTVWTPTSHQTNQNNHPSLSGRVAPKKDCRWGPTFVVFLLAHHSQPTTVVRITRRPWWKTLPLCQCNSVIFKRQMVPRLKGIWHPM